MGVTFDLHLNDGTVKRFVNEACYRHFRETRNLKINSFSEIKQIKAISHTHVYPNSEAAEYFKIFKQSKLGEYFPENEEQLLKEGMTLPGSYPWLFSYGLLCFHRFPFEYYWVSNTIVKLVKEFNCTFEVAAPLAQTIYIQRYKDILYLTPFIELNHSVTDGNNLSSKNISSWLDRFLNIKNTIPPLTESDEEYTDSYDGKSRVKNKYWSFYPANTYLLQSILKNINNPEESLYHHIYSKFFNEYNKAMSDIIRIHKYPTEKDRVRYSPSVDMLGKIVESLREI